MTEVLSIDLSEKPYRSYLVDCTSPPVLIQKHEVSPEEGETLSETLSRLIDPLSKSYEESVLFISSPHYHSLNIHLPFSDQKKIAQVLPGMIQDLLPFETDNFLATPTISQNGTATSSTVHVGVVDKDCVKKAFEACKSLKLDPILIAPPTAALSTLIPLESKERVMIVVSDNDFSVIGIFVNRKLVADRVVRDYPIKQVIASLTQAYPVEEIFWFGESCKIPEARVLPLPAPSREFLAVCGATLGVISESKNLPINFRIGEYRLSPRFELLFGSLIKAKKAFLWFVIILATYLLIKFISLGFSERALKKAMIEQVRSSNPSIPVSDEPASDLRNATLALERQLQGLGSIQQLSPVEILAMISKDIPSTAGVQIQTFEVKEGSVLLEGVAPEYQSIERLKKEFDKKRLTYCSVRLSNISEQRGRRVFRFDLVICEKNS